MKEQLTAEEYRKVKPKRKQHKEESLQIQVARYLKLKHPDIIFHSDVASGMKLTMGQAMKNKAMQSGKGFPDMFIAQPNLNHSGLFLELKKEGSTVWLRNGLLSQNEHIQGQHAIHRRLHSNGYYATFAIGFNSAVEIIEKYFSSEI